MNLEDQLRSALGRREPPAGFAARVLGAIPQPKPRRLWVRRAAAWAVAAGLVIGAGLEYRRVRQGREAKEKVMLALRIASTELRTAQQRVERHSRPRAVPREAMENR